MTRFLKKEAWVGPDGILRHPLFNTVVGSGLLTLILFLITWKLTEREKANDQQRLAHEQRVTLCNKLLDEGDRSLSVSAAYLRLYTWIRLTPRDSTNLFDHRLTWPEVEKEDNEIYSIVIETPELPGLLGGIEGTFPPDQVLENEVSRLKKIYREMQDASSRPYQKGKDVAATADMNFQAIVEAANIQMGRVTRAMQMCISKDAK